jgi:hypothetical protein
VSRIRTSRWILSPKQNWSERNTKSHCHLSYGFRRSSHPRSDRLYRHKHRCPGKVGAKSQFAASHSTLLRRTRTRRAKPSVSEPRNDAAAARPAATSGWQYPMFRAWRKREHPRATYLIAPPEGQWSSHFSNDHSVGGRLRQVRKPARGPCHRGRRADTSSVGGRCRDPG